jgi:hypothetical protein
LSIAIAIGIQSQQSSATYKFFSLSRRRVCVASRRSPAANTIRCPLATNTGHHPPATNLACHPLATNTGDSMAKKPDEGDPSDMETIVSLLKGLQTSLAGLQQDVSTVKMNNSRLSVAVNRLQSEHLFNEKHLFKEEMLDTDGEPNESSDSSQSSSHRTSNSDGKSSKRPHRDSKHQEEHRHHSRKDIRSTPHVHKLKFPIFAGTEDPLHWIHKCEQFFRA